MDLVEIIKAGRAHLDLLIILGKRNSASCF